MTLWPRCAGVRECALWIANAAVHCTNNAQCSFHWNEIRLAAWLSGWQVFCFCMECLCVCACVWLLIQNLWFGWQSETIAARILISNICSFNDAFNFICSLLIAHGLEIIRYATNANMYERIGQCQRGRNWTDSLTFGHLTETTAGRRFRIRRRSTWQR